MDSATYTALTGKTVSDEKIFELQAGLAKKTLERMLGYPLCPDDWDNQYLEIGKTGDDWTYPDVDTSQLDAPDKVVEDYRFFTWNPRDEYLAIDPALKVHKVKLVKTGVYDQGMTEYNGFTYKTFEADEYRIQWYNDCEMPFTKYLRLHGPWYWEFRVKWTPDRFPWTYHRRTDGLLQVAVDAEWCFESAPLELKKVWADLIAVTFNTRGASTVDKSDIKSESIGSYSYTRFDGGSGTAVQAQSLNASAYMDMVKDFAGPNGSLEKPVVL